MLKDTILNLILTKEEKNMIAMLWTQRIIYGKKDFVNVPARLKDQVRELLIECGCEELITEEA